jgi:hypothetical protein
MKQTLQQMIEELIETGLGQDDDLQVRSYSGRGMYGKECLAVTADDGLAALQLIAWEAGKQGIEMPRHIRQDSMGLGVVLYWPEVDFKTTGEYKEYAEGDSCVFCGKELDAEGYCTNPACTPIEEEFQAKGV